MMRFLLDEMLPPAIASQLRKRGIDALAVAERPELHGAADVEILMVAAQEERVVVTMNIADFARLDQEYLADDRTHAGILLVSSKRFPQTAARNGAIVNALAQRSRRNTEALPLDFL